MPSLKVLPPDADWERAGACIDDDGGVIVRNLLEPDRLQRILSELQPYLSAAAPGDDDFSGRHTTRTGALVARSPSCRAVVVNPLVLALAERLLSPWCERFQLHLTQTIEVLPGQSAQPLHRDRLVWGPHLARPIEPQLNTLWALGDFTADNGATRFVPGSQKWAVGRRAGDHEIRQAEMTQGSVLIYTGTVIHGAGANRAQTPRLGMNITYSLGWLRQEENQFLSCPPEIARELTPDLQELLGYTTANYALGYYSDPKRVAEGVPDTLSPERALGRGPRSPDHAIPDV